MSLVEPPKIAIVVPVGRVHEKVERCIESCSKLEYDRYVTLLVTDAPVDLAARYGATNIVTGSKTMTGPAVKRDIAIAAYPDADVYAFLDDDAYVERDWLKRVARIMEEHPEADALGGPGLMPDDQQIAEQLSAAVMETWLGSGRVRFRFVKGMPRYCDDFPAYNLMIRRDALVSIGGWASNLYGGEDTFVCSKLVRNGRKIYYDPSLYVYHYRRSIWPKHAWQVFNIGRSRACFIREGDPVSRKLFYFLPLAVALFTLACIAAGVSAPAFRLPVLGAAFLVWVGVASFAHDRGLRPIVRLLLPVGLIIHHFSYAYGFLLGLVTGKRNGVSGKQPSFTIGGE